MNIVEMLCDEIINNKFFFYHDYSDENSIKNMSRLVIDYLKESVEGKRDFFARQIMFYGLLPHDKGDIVASFGDIMNTVEVFNEYEHKKKNRKHLSHSVNTYLLGLLLYNKVPILKSNIIKEMNDTMDGQIFRNPNDEFLFRWRIASFMHDFGNGIQICCNDNIAIDKYLFHFMIRSIGNWYSDSPYCRNTELYVEDLCNLSDQVNALKELDKIDCNGTSITRLSDFFELLKQNPYKNIYYDHGIVSALIILKTIDDLYCRNNIYSNPMYNRINFKISVMRAAYAVCMHNLDFYPNKYIKEWPTKLYDINTRPFNFLLKLADTLQEWNKVKAINEKDYIDPSEIELQIRGGKLFIEKYPEKKIDDLMKKLSNIFDTGNQIIISNNLTIYQSTKKWLRNMLQIKF